MKTILLITGLCVAAMSSYAQNIRTSTISWHVTQAFDINTGTTTDVTDTIISVSASQLQWKTDNSTKIFTVSEVIGQWTDVDNNGEIVYEASCENLRGTVTFLRSAGVIRIRLLMADEAPYSYEFTVSGYQVQ
jgi:hypothetical protein